MDIGYMKDYLTAAVRIIGSRAHPRFHFKKLEYTVIIGENLNPFAQLLWLIMQSKITFLLRWTNLARVNSRLDE